MKTLNELYTVLAGTHLPVAYGFFKDEEEVEEGEGVSLPCITYQVAYSGNFGAENRVYEKIENVDIFLFTKTKDPATEYILESALDAADIFWQVTETYLSTQKCIQRIYEVQTYG